MGTIKINGDNKEMTNLSLDQVSATVQNSESQSSEFKVDTSLLENLEISKVRLINNLA